MNSNKHLVALVLAIGISVWLVLMGINIIYQEFPISDQLSTLLSTSLGATVGALAVYLGGKDRGDDTIHHDPPDANPAQGWLDNPRRAEDDSENL